MKRPLSLLVLVLIAAAAHAAGKSCQDLATEIAAKLNAAGVKDYVLEIVPNALDNGEKVVGSCDGGAMKITYAKVKKAPAPPSKQP